MSSLKLSQMRNHVDIITAWVGFPSYFIPNKIYTCLQQVILKPECPNDSLSGKGTPVPLWFDFSLKHISLTKTMLYQAGMSSTEVCSPHSIPEFPVRSPCTTATAQWELYNAYVCMQPCTPQTKQKEKRENKKARYGSAHTCNPNTEAEESEF